MLIGQVPRLLECTWGAPSKDRIIMCAGMSDVKRHHIILKEASAYNVYGSLTDGLVETAKVFPTETKKKRNNLDNVTHCVVLSGP